LTSKEDIFLKNDCGREKPEKKQIAQIGLRSEPSLPRRHVPFWISEEYAVLPELVEDILEQFKVRPEVDAFACNGNQQFARWWGPGSLEHEDAFTCDWGKELLWANPPFSLLQRVVQKIVKDAAHIVLVVPVWPRKDWYQEAENLSILTLSCPAGQQVFQLQGKKCKETKWAVEAMLICAHEKVCDVKDLQKNNSKKFSSRSQEEEKVPPPSPPLANKVLTTKAAKRKARRSKLEAARQKKQIEPRPGAEARCPVMC
jgi:hypothetical protein